MDDDVAMVCRLCMETLELKHTMEDSETLKMVEDCLQLTVADSLVVAVNLLPTALKNHSPSSQFTIVPPFLSPEICDDCYYKIKDFYEYKENCRAMQDLLRQDIEDYGGMRTALEKTYEDAVHVTASEQLGNASSVESEESFDDTVPVIKKPPVILNSSLIARKTNLSRRENKTDCDVTGEVECIKVSLVSSRDSVIVVNKKTYHECSLCNRSFNDPYRLQQHVLGHKKKRTYLCEYCPMSFPQNSSLQVHIRSHTKEKPFVCPHCGNAYGYFQLLKKHLSRYHAQESRESFNAGKQSVN